MRPNRQSALKALDNIHRWTEHGEVRRTSSMSAKTSLRSARAARWAGKENTAGSAGSATPHPAKKKRKRQPAFQTPRMESRVCDVLRTPVTHIKSPQKLKRRRRAVLGSTRRQDGRKLQLGKSSLIEYMTMVLQREVRVLDLKDIEAALTVPFSVQGWACERKSSPTVRRAVRASSADARMDDVVREVVFTHKGRDTSVHFSAIVAFLVGDNYSQWRHRRNLEGSPTLSRPTFCSTVGKRLRSVMQPLWKLTQRLVLVHVANEHLERRWWDGRAP